MAEHHFAKGDALIFLSHKSHCVRAVNSGTREVLVIELWEGMERSCDHRCDQRWGSCWMEEKTQRGNGQNYVADTMADSENTRRQLAMIKEDAPAAFVPA